MPNCQPTANSKQQIAKQDFTQAPKSGVGFTLIELLIAISILAILATIGLISYSVVMKQGRDSRRQSDMRAIQAALEQYFEDQGYYPSADGFAMSINSSTCPAPAGIFRFGCDLTDPAGARIYINAIPKDPKNDSISLTFYTYIPLSAGSGTCDNSSTSTMCATYDLSYRSERSSSHVSLFP